MGFAERVQQAVLLFRDRVTSGPVLVIGNLDTDGLTATSILAHALTREGIPFAVHIIKQITPGFLDELKNMDYGTFFFADLGSSSLRGLASALQGKHIFILDHHPPEKTIIQDLIVHVNPHLDGIDGTKDISAAGVCYFFARELNKANVDVAHLALIGAVGDVQERMGFTGLNREILRDALESGTIEMKEGLRMFGIYTKPLSKVLEFSTNPYVPGVTGDNQGAVRFLEEHGIVDRGKAHSAKLVDLSPLAVEKLRNALQKSVSEQFVGPVYLLRHERDDSPLRELKEFSTLLNACGRMDKASLGIGVCLGDEQSRIRAMDVLHDYRKEIITALQWFYRHRGTDAVREHKGFTLIYAEDEIRDTLIGTLTSLLSKSNIYPDGTILVGAAFTLEEDIKISARIAGYRDSSVDLRTVMISLAEQCGGHGGGHRLAAGAHLPRSCRDLLLQTTLRILEHTVLEEHLVP